MPGKAFVDTNVLVYARDTACRDKQVVARGVLEKLWHDKSGRLSVQVLSEYYVSVTQKLRPGMSRDEAWEDVKALMAWGPVPSDTVLLCAGREIQDRHGLSWWDALIIAAAVRAGCDTIFTEDLNAGQSYDGVTAVNPFYKMSES